MPVFAHFRVQGKLLVRKVVTQLDPFAFSSEIISLAKACTFAFQGHYPPAYQQTPHQDLSFFNRLQTLDISQRCVIVDRMPACQRWVDFIWKSAIKDKKGYRNKRDLHVLMDLSPQYLNQVKFDSHLSDHSSLKDIFPDQAKANEKPQKKTLLVIYKPQFRPGRFTRIQLPGIFIGTFYNNQQWGVYQAGIGELPSEQEFLQADRIIIPGSISSTLQNNPTLDTLRHRLKLAYQKGNGKILGVCFGHQLVSQALGGECRKMAIPSTRAQIIQHIDLQNLDFAKNLPNPFSQYQHAQVIEHHVDEVYKKPPSFRSLVTLNGSDCEMLISPDERVLTVQCHPQYGSSLSQWYGLQYDSQMTDSQLLCLNKVPEYEDCLKMREIVKCFMGLPL